MEYEYDRTIGKLTLEAALEMIPMRSKLTRMGQTKSGFDRLGKALSFAHFHFAIVCGVTASLVARLPG